MTPNRVRRKVRKGTTSCWECKRRKIRCRPSTNESETCEGCIRRGGTCTSQEYEDDSRLNVNNTSQRVARLESLISQLLRKVGDEQVNVISARSAGLTKPGLQARSGEHIFQLLAEVWPSSTVLETIFDISDDPTILFHGNMCCPIATLAKNFPKKARHAIVFPCQTEPVLLARTMLLLLVFIQGLPNCANKRFQDLGIDRQELKEEIFGTIRAWVTCDDNRLECAEGLHCLLLESWYLNNEGNLRLMWKTLRRALALAQVFGLHQFDDAPVDIRFLDAKNSELIQPAWMWFQLVEADRYASLLLGLPQAWNDDRFATSEAFQHYREEEKVRVMQCVTAGMILSRNGTRQFSLDRTRQIDSRLEITAIMGANIDRSIEQDCHPMRNLYSMLMTTGQLTNLSLIIHLHLPHMLDSTQDEEFNNSRLRAMNASRDLLTYLISIGNQKSIASFCRGVNYIVFLACTVLCVGYCHHHRWRRQPTKDYESVWAVLVDQRSSDRASMQSSLENFHRLYAEEKDQIAGRMGALLDSLLAIEAEAAVHGNINAIASSEYDLGATDIRGHFTAGQNQAFEVHLPQKSVIRFEVHADTNVAGQNAIIANGDSIRPQTYESGDILAGENDLWNAGGDLLDFVSSIAEDSLFDENEFASHSWI